MNSKRVAACGTVPVARYLDGFRIPRCIVGTWAPQASGDTLGLPSRAGERTADWYLNVARQVSFRELCRDGESRTSRVVGFQLRPMLRLPNRVGPSAGFV